MKKAEIINEVFIYMILLVMMGMIFIFGYKAIAAISSGAGAVDDLQFRTIILSDVDKFSTEYGSMQKKEISVPNKINTVCFIENDAISRGNVELGSGYLLMDDSVSSSARENMFMFIGRNNRDMRKVYVGNISILNDPSTDLSRDFVCMNSTRGIIRVKYVGGGSVAKIGEW